MIIWVNNIVHNNLNWATKLLQDSLGIRLLSSISWDVEDAEETVYCNACMKGLAFWYPSHSQGYYSPVPICSPSEIIFYFEALAITCALDNLRVVEPNYAKVIV